MIGAMLNSSSSSASSESAIIQEIIGKAADVPLGTKKTFGVRGRKILVINDGGKFYAVNGLCTHYNYPLEDGVYSKGRIRCPLHGQCFNVKTGDIEDYPGFENVHAYQVKKVNGDLVLIATEKELSSDRRTVRLRVKPTAESPVIVIGSGPSAAAFIESARQNGLRTPIVVITTEALPPYDRVMLSKNPAVDGNSIRLRDDKYYKDHGVTFMLNTSVARINSMARTLVVTNCRALCYSQLVIATGGNVRKLTVPGYDLENVFYLRVVSDANGIAKSSPGKRIVCIGASFIGMEIAAALTGSAASVTVICSSAEPLPAFGIDVGAAIRKRFEQKGVTILTTAKTVALRGTGRVTGVELADGRVIPADVVVAGIGVLPSTSFLNFSGVNLDKRGFILVDNNFKTSAEGVHAIGDVVSAPLPYWGFQNINIQHFQTAQAHGHMLGYSIMGKPQPRAIIPFFWALFFFEFGVRFAGCAEESDEIFVRGDVDGLDFVKYYFRKEKVVAVANAGVRPISITFLEVFGRGITVMKADVLKNTSDEWDHLIK